jgi:hypothetical protein
VKPPEGGKLEPLCDALATVINEPSIDGWLQRPNTQLDGSTPLQLIERGETDRLWRMIWHLREGHSG